MKKKTYDDDDGRSIADMNVEGMPWYVHSVEKKAEQEGGSENAPPLTKKETRSLIGGALLAALCVGGVFLVAAAVFILFCIYVWFR